MPVSCRFALLYFARTNSFFGLDFLFFSFKRQKRVSTRKVLFVIQKQEAQGLKEKRPFSLLKQKTKLQPHLENLNIHSTSNTSKSRLI